MAIGRFSSFDKKLNESASSNDHVGALKDAITKIFMEQDKGKFTAAECKEIHDWLSGPATMKFLSGLLEDQDAVDEGVDSDKAVIMTDEQKKAALSKEWSYHSTGFDDIDAKLKKVISAISDMWNDIDSYASGGGFYHIVLHLKDGRVIMFSNDNAIFLSKKKYKTLKKYNADEKWENQTGLVYDVDLDTAPAKDIISAIKDEQTVSATA